MIIKRTNIYAVINDDEEMKKDLWKKKIYRVKDVFEKVVEICNQKLEDGKLKELNLDKYCVLDNVGYGTRWEIDIVKRGVRGGYRPRLKNTRTGAEGYRDPDAISYKLYLYTAMLLNQKLEKDKKLQDKIETVRVARDGYRFCLLVSLKEKGIEVKLGGDWCYSWNEVKKEGKDKEEIREMHAVANHVFWPCKKINGRQTVNQARRDCKSIKDTLKVLRESFESNFTSEKSNLHKAFNDYQSWYEVFGEGGDGFSKYVEFFSLEDKK